MCGRNLMAGKEDLTAPSFTAYRVKFEGIRFSEGSAAPVFLRADADGSGKIEITDAIVLLRFLFLTGSPPPCMKAADADDSGELDISDAIYTLASLFLGGPAPPAPFPEVGTDPTPDGLSCRG